MYEPAFKTQSCDHYSSNWTILSFFRFDGRNVVIKTRHGQQFHGLEILLWFISVKLGELFVFLDVWGTFSVMYSKVN